jgi:hypothetical protein
MSLEQGIAEIKAYSWHLSWGAGPYFKNALLQNNCQIFLLGSNMHVAKNVKDAQTFLLSYLVCTSKIWLTCLLDHQNSKR